MATPRLSFSSGSSDGGVSQDGTVSVPTTPSPQTVVHVDSITMQPGTKMPGVLNGNVNTMTFNVLVKAADDVAPEDINELVNDAVKINSETCKSFFPNDYNSFSKLNDTKEEIEGLSRRWCYLIASLVLLSFITLMGTAVLSLTSWRSASGTDYTESSYVADLSAEEAHFAVMPGGPTIVTRSQWLAAPPSGSMDSNTLPVTMVVVLHTASDFCSTQPECIDMTRNLQRFHQESRGWSDVAYNFLIGGDGSVYWGRGFDIMGAHTRGYNVGTIGVAFIGTYVTTMINERQLDAFNRLMYAGVADGKVAKNYTLVAQCQLKVTAAPGLALAHNMTSWPHFDHSRPIKCTSV